MSAEVIALDARRVTPYIVQAIEGFLSDTPDSDYQRGYLAALVAVYREGLAGTLDARVLAAEKILRGGHE